MNTRDKVLSMFPHLVDDIPAIEQEAVAPLRAEVERLRGALEAIVNHPCVVPDHPHGGVHPPYLEWKPVAHIARSALGAPETREGEKP